VSVTAASTAVTGGSATAGVGAGRFESQKPAAIAAVTPISTHGQYALDPDGERATGGRATGTRGAGPRGDADRMRPNTTPQRTQAAAAGWSKPHLGQAGTRTL
jgi:hypothetical protein